MSVKTNSIVNGLMQQPGNPGSNVVAKFREAFEDYVADEVWTEQRAAGDLVFVDGNAIAASYLVLSKSPLDVGVTQVATRQTFSMPFDMAIGLHMSQRTLGQEFSVELVSDEEPLPEPADIELVNVTQVTTTLTVNSLQPHGLRPGQRIGIHSVADSRLNYPALVVASTPTPLQFTATAGPGGNLPSLNAGPVSGGFAYLRSALGYARNGASMILEQANAAHASFFVRSEAGDVLVSGTPAGNHSVLIATTASVQPMNLPYTYCFQPSTEYRLAQMIDGLQWMDVAVDATGQATSRYKRTQVVPNPSKQYRLRLRATNNKSLSWPVATIVSATKTGTTTATIVTQQPHGLTTLDQVVIYGIRDQAAASFPNLLTATAVASVVNATTFTIVIGTASTITSYGGYVARINGGNLMSSLGAVAMVAQTAVLTAGVLTLVANVNWAGVLIGDLVQLLGVTNATNGALLGVDGAWRVRSLNTTTAELEPVGWTPPADFGLINCAGAAIKRTDLRVSFVRVLDFDRFRVEAMPRPANDSSAAMPVVLQGGATSVSGSLSAVTAAGLAIPGIIADVASAALTASTTTAAVTPTFGTSYEVAIAVTAVSGTTPTLDVAIEESDDSGTNWFRVYDFPRITATGAYRSPKLPLTGNRIRYVQTVGGTTPSFTRVINRNQASDAAPLLRQLIDRTVVSTTLNSATPALNAQNCRNVQLVVNLGAATTPPAFQLEGSDDNGATWYSIGSPLATAANATVQLTVVDIQAGLVRARVSTAGAGVTLGYALVKAF